MEPILCVSSDDVKSGPGQSRRVGLSRWSSSLPPCSTSSLPSGVGTVGFGFIRS